jgi:hypothetical protein
MALSRLILSAAVWCCFAGFAHAEQIAWRLPEELRQEPVPPSDAARYAARDAHVSRFEYNDGRVTRQVIVTDLPSGGQLAADEIGLVASDVVGRTGAATCLEHTISPARVFTLDGRAAAEILLICRGTVTPEMTSPNQINVRRTVFIRGQSRFFMFQADEYARDSEAFDQVASASRWDDAIASLAWCADSSSTCAAAQAQSAE